MDKPATKSIEIYATLPKKKTLRSKVTAAANVIEDEEYMLYDRPTQRTGLFGRSRRCEDDKKDKKRARSEERNKNVSKEFSIASTSKPTSKKAEKPKEGTETAKNQQTNASGDQKQGKKQHKIRRKLLMGGLIKRKNRSMPDLREGQDGQSSTSSEGSSNVLPKQSVDDSSVGLKGGQNDISATLSGYLSEGHLEFTGSASSGSGGSGNPNLERSRLMRKSFHGSAGKVLHVAKVPPPPPLRTTSQLSKSKSSSEVRSSEQQADKSLYPLTNSEQSMPNQSQAEVSTYNTFYMLPLFYTVKFDRFINVSVCVLFAEQCILESYECQSSDASESPGVELHGLFLGAAFLTLRFLVQRRSKQRITCGADAAEQLQQQASNSRRCSAIRKRNPLRADVRRDPSRCPQRAEPG